MIIKCYERPNKKSWIARAFIVESVDTLELEDYNEDFYKLGIYYVLKSDIAPDSKIEKKRGKKRF